MSHIRIKNEYYRTPEFIKFSKSVKSTIYFFLLAAVIRDSDLTRDISFGGHYIYTEHFLKKELVSRYPQNKMAEYLGTSQSRISKCLIELEQDGFINIIKRPTKFGEISLYQVGVWSGEIGKANYQETLWFDVIFSAFYEAAKAYRDEQRHHHPDPDKRENLFERRATIQKYYDEEFKYEC
jgi:hypothetical protein